MRSIGSMRFRTLLVSAVLASACHSDPKLPVSETPIAVSPSEPSPPTHARKEVAEKLGVARTQLKKTADVLDAEATALRETRLPDGFAVDLAVARVDLDSKSFAGVCDASLLELFAGVGRVEEQRTQLLALIAEVEPFAEAVRDASQRRIAYAVLVGLKDPSEKHVRSRTC
jgi:hypothetical protein